MDAAGAVADVLARSGETKSSLSARSGVSRALIDDYLKGRRQPSVAQLERLGRSVGLRLELRWEPIARVTDHGWAGHRPTMDPAPTTREQRAELLARVIPLARELRRRPRPVEMEFPPFRTIARDGR